MRLRKEGLVANGRKMVTSSIFSILWLLGFFLKPAIEETCNGEGLNCISCLGRNSRAIDRCQQNLIYINYTSVSNNC